MPQKKSKSTAKKTVVIKMCKAHRILVLTIFSLLFLFVFVAMILLILLGDYEIGIILLIIAVPTILFLPCPLYYATWQITFDADGIKNDFSESITKSTHGHRSKKYALRG